MAYATTQLKESAAVGHMPARLMLPHLPGDDVIGAEVEHG